MEAATQAIEERIEEVRRAGGELHITGLVHRAREVGASRPAAFAAAIRACADPEVQRFWDDWENVSDQSELALRLRTLLEADGLRDELVDFLTFFFRASAPEVYRYACLAVGRHSWTHSACDDHLRRYADEAGVPFDGPVELTGHRSRRRALLAATERYLAAPDESARPGLPLSFEAQAPDSARVPADYAALCISAERLVEAGEGPPEVVPFAWDLLESIDASLDRGGSQRGLARSWGGLLRALSGRDAERAASVWRDRLADFEIRDDRGFSERLASFWELDALISVGVEEGDELVEAAELDDAGAAFEAPFFQWFARVRHWQWRYRREGRTSAFPAPDSVPSGVGPILEELLREVFFEVEQGADYPDAIHRWIARGVGRFSDPGRWWSEPPASRALAAFLLLDAVRHLPPPRTTLRQMLGAAGISRLASRPQDGASHGLEGAPWEGFHDLLWKIFAREGAPADFPIESESLTSISSADRLLGFIRAGQTVRDADILVDALEHFVRLDIASDPAFDVRAFLFRIAARKPHASVFRELADRTRGRTYRTAEGSAVELQSAIEALAREVEEGEAHEEVEPLENDWFPELHGVRRSLLEIAGAGDIGDAVERFADQLDPRIPDPTTHRRGLVDLVGRTVPSGGALLRDSDAPVSSTSFEEFTEAITEEVRKLRESAGRLFEDPEAELAEMHRAARNAARQIEEIEEWLGPVVPERDRHILGSVAGTLRDRIGRWARLLEREIGEPLGEGAPPNSEAIEAIFEGIAERNRELSGPDRVRLVRTAYELLELRGRAEGTPPDESTPLEEEEWHYRSKLLASASSAVRASGGDFGGAEDFLVDRWEQLVEVAMEAQAETGVLELVKRPAFSELRARAADSATFERLEKWLMDRYHVTAVASLISDRRAGSAAPVPPLSVATLRSAANFGHVWLALLVGAVMLLDFGDAWVEMARTGDVPGIAATFGIGVGGTFLYLLVDIARKTQSSFGTPSWRRAASRLGRAVAFLGVCFVYALGVTSGLWYLFSGTDVVLHGAGARLQILVWTGFALFVGVFFGLLTEAA